MPATNESEAEFEARMQAELNRVLAEQEALHRQARGLPPPESAVKMRIQAFQEQAEIHRRARRGWIGSLSCIPWPIPRSRGAQPAYMGSKWLRFFRVMHHLGKKSTLLETGRSQGAWTVRTPALNKETETSGRVPWHLVELEL